jgi:hypothetical protein
MRASSEFWRVREDASREVLVALYLRDALGVVDPSGLPRLLGTGLAVDRAPIDEMTGWAWTRWWVSVVEPHTAMPPLPEHASPAWEQVLRRHLDDARTWADVAHLEYTEAVLEHTGDDAWGDEVASLVAEKEAELGRPARPFELRIEVLPLTAAGIWWIGESAIAVDGMLRDDSDSYRQALAPILARLV